LATSVQSGASVAASSTSETTVAAVHGPATGTTSRVFSESSSMLLASPGAEVPAEASSVAVGIESA
jgi:hypothetical protein